MPLPYQHPPHPAAGRQAGRFHGRLHADDGHTGVFFAQEADGRGRGGVAGHDDHLAVQLHEPRHGGVGQRLHLLAGPRAIGAVGAVAEVGERFAGQRTPDLAPDGQSAQPRVVNAYGSVVSHGRRKFARYVRPARRRTSGRSRRRAKPARRTVRGPPCRRA